MWIIFGMDDRWEEEMQSYLFTMKFKAVAYLNENARLDQTKPRQAGMQGKEQ